MFEYAIGLAEEGKPQEAFEESASAFAPGISHHEPGDLSTRQLISLIHRLEGNLIGADIVEYNPTRDQNGVTAMVAAKLLKEIIGRMCALF